MYETIERLRELLTERGIKYKAPYTSDDTYWNANGIRWHAFESGANTIWITCNSDVDFTPEQVIAITLGEERSCASCPEMDNPDSYIFHLMRALEHERGCCRDCKHSHMTSDGKHCKWCSVLATHDIEGEGYCDPPNGYDPEPYFDADFYCGFFERRVDE